MGGGKWKFVDLVQLEDGGGGPGGGGAGASGSGTGADATVNTGGARGGAYCGGNHLVQVDRCNSNKVQVSIGRL